MNAEFIQALNQIEKEKGIDKEILIEAVENSLVTACKNHFGPAAVIEVKIDREKGDIKVFQNKEIVEESEDDKITVSLEDARKLDRNYNIGDVIKEEVTPQNFGRIAAQKAKQVVVQKIREEERNVLFNYFKEKEHEMITGIIQRKTKDMVIVHLGKLDATLPKKEQIDMEKYVPNSRMKFYVVEVKQSTKGPKVTISRTHSGLVKRLFEENVPEIYDGVVEIKGIVREAGSRTKIAVHSNNENVDPLGACVGPNGARVKQIVDKLGGEKIDIIIWDKEPEKLIAAALSPAKVSDIRVDKETQKAKVIVEDYQLSLAIGKEGQNARLAANLTGFKIDIKSETQAKELNFFEE